MAEKRLKLQKTEKIVRMFADKVIKSAVKNLAKNTDRGKIAQKLSYDLKVYDSGSLEFNFDMPIYGKFQDQGVKGSKGGRRAYKSPYKFTGSNLKRGVVEGWLKRKGIQGRVDSKWKSAGNRGGQFISRKSYAFIIGRKIALFGLPATRFFSNAFRLHYRKLPKDFIRAYASDVAKFIKTTTQDIK